MAELEHKKKKSNRIQKYVFGIIVFAYLWIYYKQNMLNVTNLLGYIVLIFPLICVFQYTEKAKPFIMFIIMSLIDYIFLEANTLRSICLDGIEATVFFSCLLVFLVTCIVFYFSNNIWISTGIIQGVISLFGLANYFLCMFRGRALYYSDLASARTAMNVAGQYDFSLDKFSGIQLVLIWLIPVYMIGFFMNKQDRRTSLRLACRMKKIAITVLTVFLLYNSVSLGFFGFEVYWWAHNTQNGFLLGFVLQGENYGSKADSSYAIEDIEKMSEQYQADAIPFAEQTDIIVVMNESFSDLGIIGELETNQEVMPFYKSLKDNCIKGNLYVSVKGGNTANTEYEFLTGDTMAFYKYGQVVYNSYLNHNVCSSVSYLKEKGYNTFAFHPWDQSGWNRPNVYNNFQFDQMLFFNDLDPDEIGYMRIVPSDSYDYWKVGKIYESMPEDPRFIFNVTMQNHAGYGLDYGEIDQKITLVGDDADEYPLATQYLSLIYESDKALEQLIDSYRDSDRRVLICFFGDHQPTVEESFFEKLYGKPLNELTLEEEQRQYVTPFLIWTNYDIESEYIDKMSANYLFAYVAKVAGMELSPFQNYLLDLYEQYPVINAIGAIDRDDNYYTSEELADRDGIQEYFNIIYNQIIDVGNTVEQFFHSN